MSAILCNELQSENESGKCIALQGSMLSFRDVGHDLPGKGEGKGLTKGWGWSV